MLADVRAVDLFILARDECECTNKNCGARRGVNCFTEKNRDARITPHIERLRAYLNAHPDTTVKGGQIKTRSDIKGIR